MNQKKLNFFLFTAAEHWSIRVLDALTTIILIRNLNREALGTFVIYQSWVGILLLLFPALENILYREYSSIKAEGRLGFELSVFKKFNQIKIILALFLIVLCSFIPVLGLTTGISWTDKLSALTLAFALPLSQALYGIFKETLRFELKQKSIVVLSALQRIVLIAVIYVVSQKFTGAITPIAFSALLVFIFFGFLWSKVVHKQLIHIEQPKLSLNQAIPRIFSSLKDVIFWIHINGALTIAIQTLDVYFLSHFQSNLSEIAIYSVALKAANFFQVIPLPFAQVFGVYLGRKPDLESKSTAVKIVLIGTACFGILGLIMYKFGVIFSEPLLSFLAKGKFTSEELIRAQSYFKWQLLGIAAFLLCYVPGAYINRRGNLKSMTLIVFIPWVIFSLIGYAWAAHQSIQMAAFFNVPIYLMCSALHLCYFFLVFLIKQP